MPLSSRFLVPLCLSGGIIGVQRFLKRVHVWLVAHCQHLSDFLPDILIFTVATEARTGLQDDWATERSGNSRDGDPSVLSTAMSGSFEFHRTSGLPAS